MKTNKIKYCREMIFLVISVCSEHFPPFLGTLTLLSFLPAFLYGCDAPQALPRTASETVTRISLETVSMQVEEMDIFVFRNDRLQKLDCYQRVEDPLSWNNDLISSFGEMIIAVCANSSKAFSEWYSLSSLSHLGSLTYSLENESQTRPFMSGMAETSAGPEYRNVSICLRPLFSIVELRSIRCDFSGRPYDGEILEEVKVYLTNVNAECRILDEQDILPTRIVNAGEVREDDMDMFTDPSIIYRSIEGSIGKTAVKPDIQLICYPNNSMTEGPGTPFTRLVIEGKIKGETFYWPLNINKENEGYGIGRNEKYTFDVKITRKGTKDPDIPVSKEDIEINLKIEKWDERQDCAIIF